MTPIAMSAIPLSDPLAIGDDPAPSMSTPSPSRIQIQAAAVTAIRQVATTSLSRCSTASRTVGSRALGLVGRIPLWPTERPLVLVVLIGQAVLRPGEMCQRAVTSHQIELDRADPLG